SLGQRTADTFQACKSGAHKGYSGDLVELVRDARFLAEKLRGSAGGGATGLATVLFTDIVASAEKASMLGDQGWRKLLDEHVRTVGEIVVRHQGKLVKETGDGVLATFDGPGHGVRAARAIREQI